MITAPRYAVPVILVALSGGPDSTALLIALAELGDVELAAVHVNHHLRGAESDADEAFVRALCQRLGVPLSVADGTLDPARVRAAGVEAAAREVRLARLRELREATGADFIATAHQKNDQAETVLMRLVAGGGVAALRGIHPLRADGIVRPILGMTRGEIERFLAERGVVPRHDSSNDDPRFLRNRVRRVLRALDPELVERLAALADRARQLWPLMERALDVADDAVALPDETRFRWLASDPRLRQALLHRHIHRLDPGARDVSARDLERLAAEVDRVKRISVTKTLEIVRRGDAVVLRKRPQPSEPFEASLRAGEEVFIPQIKTRLGVRAITPASGNRQPATALFQLPAGAAPAFIVRSRRSGDRVGAEKKLKDLLIDRKIEAELRDRIPLLLWNDRIVWVPGVGVSDAFRVTEPPADLYEASIEEDQEGVQREGDSPAHRRARR
jgi:tRNA(Ile)-lysidine synthetase-like protein